MSLNLYDTCVEDLGDIIEVGYLDISYNDRLKSLCNIQKIIKLLNKKYNLLVHHHYLTIHLHCKILIM